jgi:hypothetical protein
VRRGKTKCSRACSPATLPDFRQGPSVCPRCFESACRPPRCRPRCSRSSDDP